MSDDRRAVLESIAYGSDDRISPADRLRAIEALRELDDEQRRVSATRVEELSPEEVLTEVESFAGAVPGMLACAKVAAGCAVADAVEPPSEIDELRETLGLAAELTDVQARHITELETALAYEHRHRLLPAAPRLS